MWGFQSLCLLRLSLLTWQAAASGSSDELYQCHSDLALGPVSKAAQKGFNVDDTTWRWCSEAIPSRWPNADEPVTSIRLFKAWHADWQDDREAAWQNLKNFVTATGAKVLLGTSISCVEEEDAQDWIWVKELAQLLGKDHVMGLAIGNELELVHSKTAFSEHIDADCVRDLWDDGRFWRRFTEITQEFDDLGFETVPVTSVFGGLALAGNSTHPFFEEPGKALVNSFFINATERYGDRYAWTWNVYPYFDPNEELDEGTTDSCEAARNKSLCFATSCDAPKSMAYYRTKMAKLTNKTNDIMWIGETGWSSKGSVNSDMKYCKNWAAMESLERYYSNFLAWDLSVPGEEPPDHVFYFGIRDALNFGNDEHFGVIEQCFMPACKLHSEDFVPPAAPTPTHPGCYYQQPTEGNGKCDGPWKFWKIDEYGYSGGSWDNESSCLSRKAGHDGWCGTDTSWLFVPAQSMTTTSQVSSGISSTTSTTTSMATISTTTSTTDVTITSTTTTEVEASATTKEVKSTTADGEATTTEEVESTTADGEVVTTTEGVTSTTTEKRESTTADGELATTTEGVASTRTAEVESTTADGGAVTTTKGVASTTTDEVKSTTTDVESISTSKLEISTTTVGVESTTADGEAETTAKVEVSTTTEGLESTTTDGEAATTANIEDSTTAEGQAATTTKDEVSTTAEGLESTTAEEEAKMSTTKPSTTGVEASTTEGGSGTTQEALPTTSQGGSATTREGEVTTTAPAAVTIEVVLVGDYDTVVGNDKTLFLRECSGKLNPVSCVDVRPGSIVVVLSGTGSTPEQANAAVSSAKDDIQTNGLVLTGFGSLMVQDFVGDEVMSSSRRCAAARLLLRIYFVLHMSMGACSCLL